MKTHALIEDIEYQDGSETVRVAAGTEIKVRGLKGSDMLALDQWSKAQKGEQEIGLLLIERVTGLPFKAVLEMSGDDIEAITANFSKKRPGGTALPGE